MNMRTQKAFTLIELVMVIVIIGILAVVAIPRFLDMADEAKAAAEKGVVGGVRAGIYTYYAKNKAYPADLGACGATGCFTTVLGEGSVSADDDWSGDGTAFTGPTGTGYTYDSTTGSFLED